MASLVVYGDHDPLPLVGFPEGRARIRMRNDDYVMVYIRPPVGGIRKFVVEEKDGTWRPAFEIGRNVALQLAGEEGA